LRTGYPFRKTGEERPRPSVRVHCRGAIMGTHANPETSPSRRSLLQVGSLGLTLPRLLEARADSRTSDRSCIFIVQYGGASHHDSLDPKPDAPEDVRGPYRAIATATAGLRLGEKLPRLARL